VSLKHNVFFVITSKETAGVKSQMTKSKRKLRHHKR